MTNYQAVMTEITALRAAGHNDILVSLEEGTHEANWGEACALPREQMEAEMAELEYDTGGMMDDVEFEAIYNWRAEKGIL